MKNKTTKKQTCTQNKTARQNTETVCDDTYAKKL